MLNERAERAENCTALAHELEPFAPAAGLCPLDGAATEPFSDEFVVCTRCNEMLKPDETVAKATPDTWVAYLLAGATDTDPEDAPLTRLNAAC